MTSELTNHVSSGTVEGTGSALTVKVGFKPLAVWLYNVDGGSQLFWNNQMADDAGYKSLSNRPAVEDVNVIDDDSAASNGVALYLHTKNGVEGWLEFVSPTNADATASLSDGGATLFVFDSDAAATDGVAVYIDEDAANQEERFLVVSPSGEDILVPVGLDKYIRFKHDNDAASNGVQVYIDEDAVNVYEKLLFVSPTDTDAVGATDSQRASLAGAFGVANLSASNGITPTFNGFTLGADTDLNVASETIYWVAIK